MPKTRETKIENGIQLWPCRKCGVWLPKESYYVDKRIKNGKFAGIRGICKQCFLEYHQEIYCQRPEVKAKERTRSIIRGRTLKAKCRGITNEAIQSGKLVKPSFCPDCGISNKEKRIEAHHEDYFRPLEIKWKCSVCHTKWHHEHPEVGRLPAEESQ